jgi:hypothetical protein
MHFGKRELWKKKQSLLTTKRKVIMPGTGMIDAFERSQNPSNNSSSNTSTSSNGGNTSTSSNGGQKPSAVEAAVTGAIKGAVVGTAIAGPIGGLMGAKAGAAMAGAIAAAKFGAAAGATTGATGNLSANGYKTEAKVLGTAVTASSGVAAVSKAVNSAKDNKKKD